MSTKYKRRTISNSYYAIEIFECSKDLILFSAQQGFEFTTIENFDNYNNDCGLDLTLNCNSGIVKPIIKKYSMDFQLIGNDFLNLIPLWDRKGCYALFHKLPLKFRANDLDESSR